MTTKQSCVVHGCTAHAQDLHGLPVCQGHVAHHEVEYGLLTPSLRFVPVKDREYPAWARAAHEGQPVRGAIRYRDDVFTCDAKPASSS